MLSRGSWQEVQRFAGEKDTQKPVLLLLLLPGQTQSRMGRGLGAVSWQQLTPRLYTQAQGSQHPFPTAARHAGQFPQDRSTSAELARGTGCELSCPGLCPQSTCLPPAQPDVGPLSGTASSLLPQDWGWCEVWAVGFGGSPGQVMVGGLCPMRAPAGNSWGSLIQWISWFKASRSFPGVRGSQRHTQASVAQARHRAKKPDFTVLEGQRQDLGTPCRSRVQFPRDT